jgi:hypothetical protein
VRERKKWRGWHVQMMRCLFDFGIRRNQRAYVPHLIVFRCRFDEFVLCNAINFKFRLCLLRFRRGSEESRAAVGNGVGNCVKCPQLRPQK